MRGEIMIAVSDTGNKISVYRACVPDVSYAERTCLCTCMHGVNFKRHLSCFWIIRWRLELPTSWSIWNFHPSETAKKKKKRTAKLHDTINYTSFYLHFSRNRSDFCLHKNCKFWKICYSRKFLTKPVNWSFLIILGSSRRNKFRFKKKQL